jgi:O-antigen biosynthesis protein WbqP
MNKIVFNSPTKTTEISVVKRLFDILISTLLLLIFSIPMVLIAIAIKLTSTGPVLYWSDRVGAKNKIFRMPKFRTMHTGTPIVATHLLASPDRHMTGIGKLLRKNSIDELPQLFSVLYGDMSLVGPRPALYNQDDLIALRTEKGIHRLVPGITGWAQINGRDDLPIPKKVELDAYYLENQSFIMDMKTIILTVFSVLGSKGISH